MRNSSHVQYDFNNPYAGASELSLIYTGQNNTVINSLNFTVNANITGTPWGALWPWGSNMTAQANGDGTTTYNIQFPNNGVTLPANMLMSLTYTYDGVAGPLPVAMVPTQVTAMSQGALMPVTVNGHCIDQDCVDPTPGLRVATYVANWDIYQRHFFPSDLPIRYTNQWLYAFLNFDVNGNILLFDPNSDEQLLPQIAMIRQRYPYLDTSLSIGGWTLSADFSPMAANPVARANFVAQAVAAMKQLGMNGIDIDWEYPVTRNGQPGDAKNFASLMTELREALDNQAKKDSKATDQEVQYHLSIAAPAGIDKLEAMEQDYPNVWQDLIAADVTINLMAYDFHGAFDQISDNQSAMQTDPRDPFYQNFPGRDYDVTDAVDAYVSRGFSSQTIILGAPIYGRAMNVATLGETNGLWQEVTATPPGQFDDSGMFDYNCVLANECHGGTSLPSDTQLIPAANNPLANVTLSPWGVSASAREVVTYDDAASAKTKADFVLQNHLGGSMFWLASGDFNASDSRSIIGTTVRTYQQNMGQLNSGELSVGTFLTGLLAMRLLLKQFGAYVCDWWRGKETEQTATLSVYNDAALNKMISLFRNLQSAVNHNPVLADYRLAYDSLSEDIDELFRKGKMTPQQRTGILCDLNYFLKETNNELGEQRHEQIAQQLQTARGRGQEFSSRVNPLASLGLFATNSAPRPLIDAHTGATLASGSQR